jgi:hypothetical protein
MFASGTLHGPAASRGGTTLIVADNMDEFLPILMPTTESAALNV